MELPELHVLQRQSRPRSHAKAVARVDEGVGRGGKDAAGASGSQQGCLGLKDVQVACFHFQRRHAEHIAVGVADQIERHPLYKECRALLQVLLVQGVQHRVPGSVGRCAGSLHRFLTIVGRMAAKGALVDCSVGIAVKRHPHVLQFVHHPGGLAAHELDGVLVA